LDILKTYKYVFLFLPLFTPISCNEAAEEVYTKEAILKWQGYYAADGCGFFVEIDNKEYKPENENFIGDEFKISGDISVIIKFKYSEEKITYWCDGQVNFRLMV